MILIFICIRSLIYVSGCVVVVINVVSIRVLVVVFLLFKMFLMFLLLWEVVIVDLEWKWGW